VAEVADESARVGVGVAAAATVLGVMGVLELGQCDRRILDSEIGDPGAALQLGVAAEVGDQRVVGVENEVAAPRALADHLSPLVGEVLELAVAVELVAKEGCEDDQLWLELVDDAR